MKKKIGVAVGVFLLLFSGSWILDQRQTRMVNDVQLTEERQGLMQISNVNMDKSSILDTMSNQFLPREYIRIQHKEDYKNEEGKNYFIDE